MNLYIIIALIIVIIIIAWVLIYYEYHTTPHQIFYNNKYGIKYLEDINNNTINENIMFLIPAFNCNVSLLRSRINHLVKGFKDYKIIIYGLDSTNTQTLNELRGWSEEDKKLYLVPKIDTRNLPRTVRIGTIRNQILEFAKSLKLSDNWKTIVYDCDHLGPMSKDGLIDSIERLNLNPEVYAISATGTISILPGLHFLYDSFAYKDLNGDSFKSKLHSFLSDYTRVISGYSGAILYRWGDLKNLEYKLDSELCEHIGLNQNLKNFYDSKFGKNSYMEMSKKWHIYVGIQMSNY